MSRNGLYALIGILLVADVGVVGYMFYEQSQRPGLAISIDKSGIQVQGNG